MKRNRRGFTLIEVALFLAVTGLLFVGIAVGVQNSIFQQRFNDSIQSYADFLKNVYAGVMNVQEKVPGGRGESAVYGKLVTFGENYDLSGCPVNGNGTSKEGCTFDKSKNTIFTYDVVGNIGEIESGNVIDSLTKLSADIVSSNTDENGVETVTLNGLINSYIPKWSARVEKVNCPESGSCLFTGAVLIVRHPRSGTVYTLVSDSSIQVNELMMRGDKPKEILSPLLSSFGARDVDFCINPNDTSGGVRADVRIEKNARNSSGIEIMSDRDNACMKD